MLWVPADPQYKSLEENIIVILRTMFNIILEIMN